MDAATKPTPTFALQQVGDPNVGVCEGDACLVEDRHSQALVNRQIDEGLV
jgi:NADH:ubiquinone oxidoreductase subunit E